MMEMMDLTHKDLNIAIIITFHSSRTWKKTWTWWEEKWKINMIQMELFSDDNIISEKEKEKSGTNCILDAGEKQELWT